MLELLSRASYFLAESIQFCCTRHVNFTLALWSYFLHSAAALVATSGCLP